MTTFAETAATTARASLSGREIITLRDAAREAWLVTDSGEGSGASRFIASPVYPLAIKDPAPVAGPSLSHIACALHGIHPIAATAAQVAVAEAKALACEPNSIEEAAAMLCGGARFLIVGGKVHKIGGFTITGEGTGIARISTHDSSRQNYAMPSGFELCDSSWDPSYFAGRSRRVRVESEVRELDNASRAFVRRPLEPGENIISIAAK